MENFWLPVLLMSILSGGLGYLFARRTGRNPIAWAVGACLLNILGAILICFVIADRKNVDARRS